MNCGILTLHSALNYGAFLQAYALKKTTESVSGCNVKTISLTKRRLAERIWLIKCKYPKRVIHHYRLLKAFDRERDKLEISSDGISTYDLIVVGSDELWNLENNGFIHYPEYFGRKMEGKKVIAYGVSSNAMTPERFRELTKGEEDFSSFDRVSVRDSGTLRVVNGAGRKDAETVIDPTLLMQNWNDLAVPCQEKNFILLYSMTVYEDERKAIEKLARETGKRIITVGCYNPWCDKSIYATPFEFTGYIQAADYIVTSQFHGVMFSMIFRKPFVIYPQGKPKVLDAMKTFGLEDRDATGLEELRRILDQKIDYERIDRRIQERRTESLNWLREAIDNGSAGKNGKNGKKNISVHG